MLGGADNAAYRGASPVRSAACALDPHNLRNVWHPRTVAHVLANRVQCSL
jgi:hypothetical protein